MKGTSAYQEWHDLHEMLIYGYDKEQKLFRAITYARKMCCLIIFKMDFITYLMVNCYRLLIKNTFRKCRVQKGE